MRSMTRSACISAAPPSRRARKSSSCTPTGETPAAHSTCTKSRAPAGLRCHGLRRRLPGAPIELRADAQRMELSRFAAMTGGLALFPTSLKEVDKMYEKIQREITSAVQSRLHLDRRAHERRLARRRHPAQTPRPERGQASHPRRLLRAVQAVTPPLLAATGH